MTKRVTDLIDENYELSKQLKVERQLREWRPIESAPKDGSKFLFIEERGRIQVGRMDAEWGGENSVFVCLATDSDWYPSIKPTHWMPLPEPPK